MPLPAERLESLITGDQPGLSAEARRGRKEVLWISASIWLPPIVTWVKMIASDVAFGRSGLLLSIVVNALLFLSLARGSSRARTFTLVILIPSALVNLLAPFLPYAEAPGILTGLFNGAVYGAAAFVLARSPHVQAYLDSRKGRVDFPARVPATRVAGDAALSPAVRHQEHLKPPVG